MSRTVQYTSRFKRQFQLMKRGGKKQEKFLDIVDLLADDELLPKKNKDHRLIGNYQGVVNAI